MSRTLREKLMACRADKVPRGWKTVHQLAIEEGYPTGNGNFFYIARSAVAAGLLEKKTFRLVTPTGLRTVAHFRRTGK